MSTAIENKKKKRISPAAAWRDARELIWSHRYRLMLGMFLMIVNRLAGLVLPTSSKYVIDEVIVKHRSQLLMPLAIAAASRSRSCVPKESTFRPRATFRSKRRWLPPSVEALTEYSSVMVTPCPMVASGAGR